MTEEHHLEEKVTEFGLEVCEVSPVEGIEYLVGLFEDERPERRQRLRAIPRTPFGGAEGAHDLNESLEPCAGCLF